MRTVEKNCTHCGAIMLLPIAQRHREYCGRQCYQAHSVEMRKQGVAAPRANSPRQSKCGVPEPKPSAIRAPELFAVLQAREASRRIGKAKGRGYTWQDDIRQLGIKGKKPKEAK